MNIDFLKKPEFYFQPKTILQRLFRRKYGIIRKKTPWGGDIEIDSNETIGKQISKTGIYDLAITEILWRLIEPGNFIFDIGANIGYTTILSSIKTGVKGKVWSFEPNPLLLLRLTRNIKFAKYKNINLFPIALSDSDKQGFLQLPQIYKTNEGTAFIGDERNNKTIDVELKKLDSILPPNIIVDVLKIDVEGHEFAVFKGAENSLKNKAITHIIFEDFNKFPSDVAKLLISYGYVIIRIEKGWFNVKLKDPNSVSHVERWEPTNYVATLDPTFLNEKMKGTFYNVF